MAVTVKFMKQLNLTNTTPELEKLLSDIENDLNNHSLVNMNKYQEEARQLAWKYMKSVNSSRANMLLMTTTWLSEMFWLVSKTPEIYDASIRPNEIK